MPKSKDTKDKSDKLLNPLRTTALINTSITGIPGLAPFIHNMIDPDDDEDSKKNLKR